MLFLAALLISIMAHLGMIWRTVEGNLFIGFGDGISQMLTFKQYIFEKYQQGNWAYSQDFGFGGGIFATLNYYYTTNIFMLLWFLAFVVFSIEPTIETWIHLLIPISIVKQMLLFTAAFYYLKLLIPEKRGAFIGAIIYMLSPFFFKNQINTDILVDVALYLPFLLVGIEQIIRKRSPMFFIVILTLLLINNFYIAFIVCLLGLLYIVLRFVIRFNKDEKSRLSQLKTYVWTSLLSFGMSSFIFIPATIGYLSNERPAYTEPIPWFEWNDNLLINDSRELWLPAIVLVAIAIKPLYKHKIFIFFGMIAVLGTVGYYSPMIGSIFNGFSAPNERWVPIVTLSYGGLVAFMFAHSKEIHRRDWLVSTSFAAIVITIVSAIQQDFFHPLTLLAYAWLAITLIVVFYRFRALAVSLIIMTALLIYSNYFLIDFSKTANMTGSTTEYVQGSALGVSDDIQRAAAYMNKNGLDKNARQDWSEILRENTPPLVGLDGFSTYSSISNGNLMYMYWRDLQIDSGRESLSRYRTLGDRTNLMALFQAQYYMREKKHRNIPYGVEKVGEYGKYRLYENPYKVPAFRVTNDFYNRHHLATMPVLSREHAMLEGVITEDGHAKISAPTSLPYKMTIKNAKLEGKILTVPKRKKPAKITFKLSTIPKATKSIYMQFYLRANQVRSTFNIHINELTTRRKKGDAKYATGFDALTLVIPVKKKITLTIPKGQYTFKDVQLFPESYKTLNKALNKNKTNDFVWHDDNAKGQVTVKNSNSMLVTPIPFEKGWKATVNGQKVDIQKVNYAFIGLPLEQGKNQVNLHYEPPYWRSVVSLSIVSLLLTIFIFYRRRKLLKNRTYCKYCHFVLFFIA